MRLHFTFPLGDCIFKFEIGVDPVVSLSDVDRVELNLVCLHFDVALQQAAVLNDNVESLVFQHLRLFLLEVHVDERVVRRSLVLVGFRV